MLDDYTSRTNASGPGAWGLGWGGGVKNL